eukprot:scaffold303163_cov41-Tisochrysis_lutea.AAC.1
MEKEPGESIQAAGVRAVEECLAHLFNIHAGPGLFTGIYREGRLHPPDQQATYYNDCLDWQESMINYVKDMVYERRDTVFGERGAVSQNASERVGSVCLRYRPKGIPMKGTAYCTATDLAIAHVNSVVLQVYNLLLVDKGWESDPSISAFLPFEARLFELAGLAVTQQQRVHWSRQFERRAKQSVYRRSLAYKKVMQAERRAVKLRRSQAAAKTTSDGAYKPS